MLLVIIVNTDTIVMTVTTVATVPTVANRLTDRPTDQQVNLKTNLTLFYH